eukprot:Platyproteum_vivax@DN826_c0_g1_i1.p1
MGSCSGPSEVRENGVTFKVDLLEGSGWLYEHRDSRVLLATLSKKKRVLDCYSYVGSFGVQCAVYGAAQVTCIDNNPQAIELGRETAVTHLVADSISFIQADVPKWLKEQAGEEPKRFREVEETEETASAERGSVEWGFKEARETADPTASKLTTDYSATDRKSGGLKQEFDLIVLDPPDTAWSAVGVPDSVKIYEKLVCSSCFVLAPRGYIFVASTSSLQIDGIDANVWP